MITYIIVIVILVCGVIAGRRALTNPNPLLMAADENRLGEMYGHTRDVKLKGFTAAGSALDGKLILTNKRLIWTRYDEKRHSLQLFPDDILGVKITEKGIISKSPALQITYRLSRAKKPKVATWMAPEDAVANGNPLIFMADEKFKNPHSVNSFAQLLTSWKACSGKA